MNRATRAAGLLFVIAAAIRIAVNNVVFFYNGDERVYLLYADTLASGGGYRWIVRMFLDDQSLWVFPNPLRWSYIGSAALFCSITRTIDSHALATLSTLAGIAAVALTWWIARSLFGAKIALVALALSATSPLQLALGRRALSDEFFCMAFLATIAVLLAYLRASEPRRRIAWLIAWVIVTTLAIAAKEQFLLIYPAVVLFWWLRSRRIAFREWIALALPPILFASVFCLLAGDAGSSFFQVVRIITGMMRAPYATAYQSGPPQRLLIDLLAVAPLVTIVAIAAAVSMLLDRFTSVENQSPATDDRRAALRHLTALAVAIFAVHAILPSQNLRYIVQVDALARIIVAAFVVSRMDEARRAIAVGLMVNAVVELMLFRTIFITAAVYDPVTDSLMRALRMIP